jgi:acyl-CoA reductase-like NAD-dependent aldehyde dehydrogenase
VINPSNEEPVAVISLGSEADCDAAVAAAKAAFPAWAATSPATRRAAVVRILEQYEARKEELAHAISLEMGSPLKHARESQAPCLPWHAGNFLTAFDTLEWDRPLGDHAPNDRIILEPIGVVGLITPWNWPMNQIALKAIPAILAGCTCVLKPSEESPLNAMIFAEFCHDAGLPPGVFNLVNGDGMGVGSRLSSHPDVEMISFTGSTRAGRAISKAAAETLKRVTLELGGKGANVIFADADDRAVERGVRAFGAGQLTARVPVEGDDEVAALAAAFNAAAGQVDALVAGQDRPYIGLLAWPNLAACRQLIGQPDAGFRRVALMGAFVGNKGRTIFQRVGNGRGARLVGHAFAHGGIATALQDLQEGRRVGGVAHAGRAEGDHGVDVVPGDGQLEGGELRQRGA